MPSFAAAVVAIALGAYAAGAQVSVLDEGSFTLYKDGDRVGREDFSIRTTPGPGGPTLVARATVALGARRITPGISADTSGFPIRYQREVRDGSDVLESYSGQTVRGRFSSRLLTPEGESAREFPLPPGTVEADDDIVHQLWFIVRRGAGAVVPVLVPRRNAVEPVRIERVATEQVSIDLRRFTTTHLIVRTVATNATRDVWVGSDGRIIKAAIPALGLVALRD